MRLSRHSAGTNMVLAVAGQRRHDVTMRTVSIRASARLYHLGEEDAAAQTLFYGPLGEALAVARQQPEDVQAGLWLATENDVVAFLDLDEA
jgi:hypothetical protein